MKFVQTKLKNILGASVLLLALTTGCKKDYTELDPLSSLSEVTAFTTAANIELTVNGMYNRAAVGIYEGGAGRGYPFGSANTEQGDMRGEDMINLQSFYLITYQNTYTPTTANNKNHWEQLYGLINQTNVIIQGVTGAVEQAVISSETGDAYIGEALFLRALAHHELLIHFCRPYSDNPGSNLGIPYRTIAYTTPESVAEGMTLDRGTVEAAYQNVLADLDEAENLLPDARTAKDLSISRATKGAAIAIKSRVKLFMQDYPGVIAEATKLGAASTADFSSPIGAYKLEADPTAPFLSFKNNAESIFSIAQSVNANPGVNGAISGMYGPSSLDGRDLIAVSPNLYNAKFWIAADLRKTELTFKQEGGSRPFVYAYKYRKYGDNDDWNPIVRYSEVLLNAAEAYAYTGNNGQALRLLNAVRDRSVGVSNSYGTTVPQGDVKQAIYDERRVEFFAEGKRWGDLHRLAQTPYNTAGIPAKVLPNQLSAAVYDGSTILTPALGAVAYSNFRFVWPMPATEVDSNPTLRAQQNPGY